MSNLPTTKYPFVLQMQIDKKGPWHSMTGIRSDMTVDYAVDMLDKARQRQPEHNWCLLLLKIID